MNGKLGTTVSKECDGRYSVKIGKAKPYTVPAANLILQNVTCFAFYTSNRSGVICLWRSGSYGEKLDKIQQK